MATSSDEAATRAVICGLSAAFPLDWIIKFLKNGNGILDDGNEDSVAIEAWTKQSTLTAKCCAACRTEDLGKLDQRLKALVVGQFMQKIMITAAQAPNEVIVIKGVPKNVPIWSVFSAVLHVPGGVPEIELMSLYFKNGESQLAVQFKKPLTPADQERVVYGTKVSLGIVPPSRCAPLPSLYSAPPASDEADAPSGYRSPDESSAPKANEKSSAKNQPQYFGGTVGEPLEQDSDEDYSEDEMDFDPATMYAGGANTAPRSHVGVGGVGGIGIEKLKEKNVQKLEQDNAVLRSKSSPEFDADEATGWRRYLHLLEAELEMVPGDELDQVAVEVSKLQESVSRKKQLAGALGL